MNLNICVYSSSSDKLDKKYYNFAESLGKEIAQRGNTLVFGAGARGLMGATARGAKSCGGKIIGVIPEALNLKGILYEECDKLIITPEMRSRKKALDENSDVLIALPGGFGTLEEVIEVITSKQLGYHSKPIIIVNVFGFYDNLMNQFKTFTEQHFAGDDYMDLFFVTDNIDSVFDYIENYKHVSRTVQDKYK